MIFYSAFSLLKQLHFILFSQDHKSVKAVLFKVIYKFTGFFRSCKKRRYEALCTKSFCPAGSLYKILFSVKNRDFLLSVSVCRFNSAVSKYGKYPLKSYGKTNCGDIFI